MADAQSSPCSTPSAVSDRLPSSPDDDGASPARLAFARFRLPLLTAASLLCVFGAVGAFALAEDTPLPAARSIVELLPDPDMHAQLEALADRNDVFVGEERIRRGDTLAMILNRLGVADADAERFLRTAPAARALQQLKPGRLIQARVDEDGALLSLRYLNNPVDGRDPGSFQNARSLLVERLGDSLVAHDEAIANERRVEMRSGEIRSSLFGATDAAGLPDVIATQITEIFSGDIDFYRDLRRGDRFHVVYEAYYQGGDFVRAGRILAVEFVNAGKSHAALWYGGAGPADASVAGHYYAFDGRSLRRAFLRTPLEFTRISSGFGGRMHPILNTWRQHTGIDYAAPSGTPVRVTGDGTVDFVGVKNGYGNVVVIHHQGVYSTLYGHLSGFAAGLRRGQRIEQGQLIGYVGMTGWATGPHLHYEFRIADHATNPLTAALPEAPPLARGELAAFRIAASSYEQQIRWLRAVDGVPEESSTGISSALHAVASPAHGG